MIKFWKHKPSFGSALTWAVMILLLVEIVLRLPVSEQIPAVRGTRSGERVFTAASQRSPAPKILALGSSRYQNSIVPEVIENQLGLGRGDVSNLSFDAATPQDYLHLYSTERQFFSKVELLLLEVGEFHYNWSAISDEAAGNMRFRRLADLNERLNTPSFGDKVDYGLGYFVRIWDSRFVIRDILTSAVRRRIFFDESPMNASSNGRIGLNSIQASSVFEPQGSDQLRKFGFRNFEISEYQLGAMTKLLQLAKADNVTVILMSPPHNEGFKKLVADNFAQYDQDWRDSIQNETGMQLVNIEIVDPICADWRKCFYDYGHTNLAGANGFSVALASYLKTLGY